MTCAMGGVALAGPRHPGTEEPGGLESMGSQRSSHDLLTEQAHSLCLLKWQVTFFVHIYIYAGDQREEFRPWQRS